MEKEFIPYHEALALKELGFDEPVEFYKDSSERIFDMRTPNDAPCILYQQAFRWFREKYRLLHFITPNTTRGGWDIQVIHYNGYKILYENNDNDLKYEEAELACLKKLIEIVKENL